MILTSQVAVGGTAVKLIAVPPGPSNLVIVNGGTVTMYVGGGNHGHGDGERGDRGRGGGHDAGVPRVHGDAAVGDHLGRRRWPRS